MLKVNRIHEFRCRMQQLLKNKWKQEWITGCLVLISAGLVFSRAILSVASVLVLVPLFFSLPGKKLNEKILVAVGLLLLPVIVSGFWSDDLMEWWNTVSVRIPLLTMIGCFAVRLPQQRWLLVTWVYLASVALGCIWSLLQYAIDPVTIQESYLRAKVLPTLADKDHVRFSWMVAIAVLVCIRCYTLIQARTYRNLLVILSAFFVIYLHILAAKTGLLCLYACGFLYWMHLIFVRKKWKTGLAVMAGIIAVAAIAYQTLPTLRNRVQYIRYDFSFYSKGISTPGLNDAPRLLSVKAGYDLMQGNPVKGVGFGDIRASVHTWHDQHHPQSLPYERFLPANEWMVYGAGSGWPGLLCFTAGLLLLLYVTASRNIISVLLSVTAFIPFITDDTLEGQLGVVILGFIAFFVQSHPSTDTQS
jgi:O-antigen ligase